ncbi:hypothetical protein ACH42_11965 [Endozoicomonas sp. (ex Bugula neritina AB1)]|nr:hypothetical protein ACH42_11965 [Endozoicomonas sp. (ex Bugula neritina AB1)]
MILCSIPSPILAVHFFPEERCFYSLNTNTNASDIEESEPSENNNHSSENLIDEDESTLLTPPNSPCDDSLSGSNSEPEPDDSSTGSTTASAYLCFIHPNEACECPETEEPQDLLPVIAQLTGQLSMTAFYNKLTLFE